MPRIRRRQNNNQNPEEVLKNRILKNWKTPGHKTAYSGITNIARHYNISNEKAKKILEHDTAYQTHREYKRPSIFNPYYIYGRRKLVQADLIDIQELSEFNEGIKYLLLIIDVFSKKMWVIPVKKKDARSMVVALNSWLDDIGEPRPKVMGTDEGIMFFCFK